MGQAMAEPAKSAEEAGLLYVRDSAVGIQRVKSGTRLRYLHPDGKPVVDDKTLRRIQSLVIPPAWTDVWICSSPYGHSWLP